MDRIWHRPNNPGLWLIVFAISLLSQCYGQEKGQQVKKEKVYQSLGEIMEEAIPEKLWPKTGVDPLDEGEALQLLEKYAKGKKIKVEWVYGGADARKNDQGTYTVALVGYGIADRKGFIFRNKKFFATSSQSRTHARLPLPDMTKEQVVAARKRPLFVEVTIDAIYPMQMMTFDAGVGKTRLLP